MQSLRRTLPSVVASLEREADERVEPMAIGLVKIVKTYQFVASLYFFCDVLPHVCKLSLVFQQQEVDLTVVQPQVNATLACIGAYKDNPGPNLTKLDAELSSSLRELGIIVTPEKKEAFASNIRHHFSGEMPQQ